MLITCQINKDTNSYYTTPICIYLYIINNPMNETEDAQLRNRPAGHEDYHFPFPGESKKKNMGKVTC